MSSAARTNLTSNRVALNPNLVIGVGVFRTCYAGTYLCGNRNSQEAVCKCFKHQFSGIESDYFRHDFQIADKAIQYAEEWNQFCDSDETILITKGDVHTIGGKKYLVEPLIRYFKKFTSNNGWISDDGSWTSEAMEAFSHFTYHRSGGNLIVCDLQVCLISIVIPWRKRFFGFKIPHHILIHYPQRRDATNTTNSIPANLVSNSQMLLFALVGALTVQLI
mmetsp:Transcript_19896/g.41727  ORF Transcript_19896/g.41727 Transcript_19896/m.41727 type:complete len:220 (-) Transcript_19896:459-1118(-)